jgi:hypothetical protein
LWRYLTRRHKRRRPRRARPSRDTIIDRASIHDRPKTIESRGEAGDPCDKSPIAADLLPEFGWVDSLKPF